MEKASYKNLIKNIGGWTFARKLSLAAVAILSILLFSFIIFQAYRHEFKPLYTELSQEEASSVTAWLKEQAIPFRLQNGGRSILVPAGTVYETRLDLAGAGLPKQGGVGFEVFDNQGFGVTSFTQKINYQRALQGELARTISVLDAVKSARVHLVMPEKRLLAEQQKPPKASVVLSLADGKTLDSGQIQGIVHLVAGSIEGLDKNFVTVVDASGRVLNQVVANPDEFMLPDRLKLTNSLETSLEDRVQPLLDRALGYGNSVVRVSVDLDFTQEAITKEEFDPDSIVPRSEQITESKSGQEQAGGIPGVESNLKGNASAESMPFSVQTSETTNYEISKTVRKIINSAGNVKSISAAVLLSDRITPKAQGGDGKPVPFSPEEIDLITKIVSSALGIDKARGDRIEVVSMPFSTSLTEGYAESEPSVKDYLPYAKYLLLAILGFLLYRLMIKPLMKTLKAESTMHNKTVKELETEYVKDVKALDPPERLRRELEQNSLNPARVVKAWLKEG